MHVRRGVGAAVFIAVAIACGGVGALGCDRPPETPAGVSNAAGREGAGRAGPAADAGVRPPRELDLLPRDFRARYAKITAARTVSAGHAAGRFEIEVYANEAARAHYDKQSGSFPVGAVFVKEHWERHTDPASPGPLMAMQKMGAGYDAAHGDWRYVAVSPEGEVLTDGKPDGCVLCHDDAPHDRVFKIK